MMITFDIETLPTTDERVIAQLAASIKPPGTIKKQESKDTWMQENYDIVLKEKIADTALNGAYGRIACIAWRDDNGTVFNTLKHLSESEIIKVFYDQILGAKEFCGHNIAGFDLPFLKHRSMILGIKPSSGILHAMNAKPWDDCIKDTMLMWSSDKNKMIKLETLLWLFDIKHEFHDFDGSMVAETWPVDPQKVIDYCVADVKAEYELYNRMIFNNPVF